ncbi:MAG TPA: YciI family protein [Polyangiaceae bacterium]|nr:YciI family protein [Polyangiaceae bacterium]
MSAPSTTNYLLLYRSPPWNPSPEEAQAAYGWWKAWMQKFSKEIINATDARGEAIGNLNPASKCVVYKAGAVTDGPYAEGKEVMAGFSFVAVDSLEQAIEIAKECPINKAPGASVEIRPLRRY